MGEGDARASGCAAASMLSWLKQPRQGDFSNQFYDRLVRPGRHDGPDFPEGLFFPLTYGAETTETLRWNRKQKSSACFGLP